MPEFGQGKLCYNNYTFKSLQSEMFYIMDTHIHTHTITHTHIYMHTYICTRNVAYEKYTGTLGQMENFYTVECFCFVQGCTELKIAWSLEGLKTKNSMCK